MAQDLAGKGKRAFIAILQSLRNYGNLSKTAFFFFKIFDMKVCPMLLYGSELWGLETFEYIEKVQYYACKRFINVSLKSCNYGVIGDCGRYPLYVETMKRTLRYWIKLLKMRNDRYVKKCYKMMVHYSEFGYKNLASQVKNVLYENGFGYVCENQNIENEKVFLRIIEQRLKDQLLQKWRDSVSENDKLGVYYQLKSNGYEKYLDVLNVFKFRNAFTSLRLSCHTLKIERARYRGIPREQCLCKFCPNSIEDEYHFLLLCHEYNDLRCQYIPLKYYRQPN